MEPTKEALPTKSLRRGMGTICIYLKDVDSDSQAVKLDAASMPNLKKSRIPNTSLPPKSTRGDSFNLIAETYGLAGHAHLND
jgi:hypothetical protein